MRYPSQGSIVRLHINHENWKIQLQLSCKGLISPIARLRSCKRGRATLTSGGRQFCSIVTQSATRLPPFDRLLRAVSTEGLRYQKSSLSRIASIPALAQASSASPPGAPRTPTAPTVPPPAWTRMPPPRITTPGKPRTPACGVPGCVDATRSLVLVRKLTAVHAFPAAVVGVCGPANRSRNMTCVTPKRSTMATAT